MADLSHVTDLTRKILEIAAIIVSAIIGLFIIFRLGIFLKDIFAPTPPAPPTVAFGKLPVQSFPQNFDNKTYSYTINTLSGSLPSLPDRITVYKLEQPTPNLLALNKAKSVASGADFLDAPVALSDTTYRWTKTDPLPTTLTMDIQSLDFTLTSTFKTDPTVLAAAHMPDETTALTVSKNFFDSFMPLPTSIDEGKTKTTLLAISPSGLIPASSLSTAQLIRIDYFLKAIDTIPIYTSNPSQSLIYTLISSGTTDYPQIVEAQYYHRNTSAEKATYPIKSAQTAFDELKQGKGYIAANPSGNTSITITDVTLGYYIDPSPQGYLWPVIVFQGDKGFYAYVSAVSDEWVQK